MNGESVQSIRPFVPDTVRKPDEPGWLRDLRQTAGEQFRGLPGRKVEQWKYTPVQEIKVRAPAERVAPVMPREPAPVADIAARVVLVNGEPASTGNATRQGMSVKSLSVAVASDGGDLAGLLSSLQTDGIRHGFSQLNTAALDRGLYVHVSAGVKAGELLLQWPCSAQEMNYSRLCVVLEKGARLHLVEQFENGSDEAARLNLVTQVVLGEGAELTHSRLHAYPEDSLLIDRTEVRQSAASRYFATGLDLGHGLARHDVRSEFAGSDAFCSLNTAVLGAGTSHVDYHLEADHQEVNCQSRQLFRAVAGGRSKIVFNGRVHVAPGADGSDSRQSSAGLLLSGQAEIDTKPELEILADEVVAAHGATVGQLDTTAMFYLQSRGISRKEARKMLTLAFCRSVIDQVPGRQLAGALGARLDAAMDALEHDDE